MKIFLFAALIVISLPLMNYAQQNYKITGKIIDKKENTPLSSASALVDELKIGAYSDDKGVFEIKNIPRGNYTLRFSLIGHKTYIIKITVPSAEAENIKVELEDGAVDIKEVVVTGNPFASDPKDISQSTLSLSSFDLQIKNGINLGEALNFQPGISVRSNGTSTARPVIRGFNNNRILILENGLRMGDLSGSSDDHSVGSDGSSAEKIEVVRGPASLLYGSNAIGGVINVLTQSIPNILSESIHGTFSAEGSSSSSQLLETADIHAGTGKFEFHINLYNRKAEDFKDANGNSVANSFLETKGGQFGASYLPLNGVYGLSFSIYDSKYGLPLNTLEKDGEGPVYIKMKRNEIRFLSEKSEINGLINSYCLKAGYQHYEHREINKETEETGTSFGLDSFSADLSIGHPDISVKAKGVAGFWFLSQKYTVTGKEAFTPNADYLSFAAYLLEQFKWNKINIQAGARFESNNISIPGAEISGVYFPEDNISFNSISLSAGAVYSINESLSLFSNIASAFRAPTVEELASYAIHEATGSFDIGNRNLGKENNTGFDLGLRVRRDNHSVELSGYYNDIEGYIYRKPTDKYYNPSSDSYGNITGLNNLSGFPVFRYSQSDAVIYGVETKAVYEFSGNITTTVIFDYSRGKLKNSDENLPMMPPFRFSFEQRYATDHFWAGTVLKFAAKQNLVSPYEEPTAGYGLIDFYSGLRIITGGIIHILSLRIDNALSQPYREHLSAIKSFALMPGRNFKINYKILF